MRNSRLLSCVSLFLLVSASLLFTSGSSFARSRAQSKKRTVHKSAQKKPAAAKAAKSKSRVTAKRRAASKKSSRGARATPGKANAVTQARREEVLSSSGFQPTPNEMLDDPAIRQLHSIAKTYVEHPTPGGEQTLRSFASSHPGKPAAALAYLALGYTAIENKRGAAAQEYLAAGRHIPSPVPDYFDYLLGTNLQTAGRNEEALAYLAGFEERYPQSSLVGRAVIARAIAWTATGRAPDAAALLKSRLGALKRPEADIALARAYAAQGAFTEAVQAYRQVYYLYPASAPADDAEKEIRKLYGQASLPPVPLEMRQERARKLTQAGQYAAAESAWEDVADNSSGADRERALAERAGCMFRSGRTDRAYSLVRTLQANDPEAEAERLYWKSQCERRLSRDSEFLSSIAEIARVAPASRWYEEALFSAGNFYLLDRNFEQSTQQYRTVYERFPNGKYAAEAHWRVAWKYYRTGDYETARKQFEEHIARYPQGTHVSGALYWLGRLAEDAGNKTLALAYFHKIRDTFPQYFYGTVVREKLANAQVMPASNTVLPEETQKLLASVKPSDPPLASLAPPPDLAEHRRKVDALEAADLPELAAMEVRQHVDAAHTQYLTLDLARLEYDQGRFAAAMVYIRNVYPNYFAYQFEDLNRRTWELLFPLPWWSDIHSNALRNGLDPYLVAALIRQESAFNPFAISHANAYGLMQLLPVTGRKMAGVSSRRFNSRTLLDPDRNIELGTRYLREVIDHYGGNLEAALASYNAGPERVDVWLQLDKPREAAEFVENIPFTETREYVQALVRNAAVYRRLYGLGSGSGTASASNRSAARSAEQKP